MVSKLSDKERESIPALRDSGLTLKSIAALYGVSIPLISLILRPSAYEINKRKRAGRKYYDKERECARVKKWREKRRKIANGACNGEQK